MGGWQIQLQGEESDIGLLEDLLCRSPFRVESEGSRKFLSLPGVASHAASEAVHAAADDLIETVNGAARLYYERFHGVTFTTVSRIAEDGRRTGYGYLTAEHRNTRLIAINPNDDTLAEWIARATHDVEIERVFALYGALEPNWKNLYLILEAVEDSLGSEAALKGSGLVGSQDITLFKRTANSYRAIGREARHATLAYDPPDDPMALSDARTLVRSLVKSWIQAKKERSA